jgi:hypothetical protein
MKHNGCMGLIDRIFRSGNRDAAPGSSSTQFHESEPDSTDSQPSRNAPRRELVQVVLRDTMRKHGIPSDWIECRILSAITRNGRSGLHLNFVVRQAHDRLITYVFAFQDSFERELARFEPRAQDWLLSLGWEFQGFKPAEMPAAPLWAQNGAAPLAAAADMSPLDMPMEKAASPADEDVERDLRALFAIRDAAMADTSRRGPARGDQADFQPTQPFEESDPPRS